MELIDIIDENDKVIYQITKQAAHEKGLLHRCVIAEVIDGEGKWILVKQASDRQDAGQFVSPVGGHVSAGESEIDALKREADEELGLTKFTYKFIGQAIFNRFVKNRQENHLYIVYEIYTNQEPHLNYESESYMRFTILELKKALKNDSKSFGAAFEFVVKSFYSEVFL